jgi:hypothetical protein
MKPRYLLIAIAIALGSGCFFSSQPVNDPALGSNCKAVTSGLMFLSKPDVTCDQPVQAPAPPSGTNVPH